VNTTKTNNKNKTVVSIDKIEFIGIKELYASIFIKGSQKLDSFIVVADEVKIDHTKRILSDVGDLKIEIRVPEQAKNIQIICRRNGQNYNIVNISISPWKKAKQIIKKCYYLLQRMFIVLGRGIRFLWREHHFIIPPSLWKQYISKYAKRVKERGEILLNPFIISDYEKWILNFEEDSDIIDLHYRPLISVLIPVYNVEPKYLKECLDSVLQQSYNNFEVCIVDDNSGNKDTIDVLKAYESIDERINVKYRKVNGHISTATNDALTMSQGEFIALVDNDDVLHKDALYENVKALNENKKLDFIYSDEDKLDVRGNRCDPHFKPDYSPDTLLGINYICHFVVIRKSLVEKVSGFRVGFEGAQDHDLFLRIVEQTSNIHHIPKILYHWRMIAGSTSTDIGNKGYAIDKGIKAVNEAIHRRGKNAEVTNISNSTVYKIKYKMKKQPLVSIIIPMKDHAAITRKCLHSIYDKTQYENFEILLVNNNSHEEESFTFFKECQTLYDNIKIIDANIEFNYSKLNNIAAKQARGEYLLLLNNDTEVISPDWLYEMICYASQDHIGAVGPKLLYSDNTIQHAGVLLGLGQGVASHAFLEEQNGVDGIYGRLLIPYNYSAVTAACLAVSKEKYFQVGGLEEDLKVAYNDIDFNLKLLSQGYFNICLPQIELIHYESKSRGLDSTKEKYELFISESNYMYHKWGPLIQNDPYYNSNLSKKGLYLLERDNKGQ
jgi:Glycosyltransferases, probably involved in cell wall biogenesis